MNEDVSNVVKKVTLLTNAKVLMKREDQLHHHDLVLQEGHQAVDQDHQDHNHDNIICYNIHYNQNFIIFLNE